MPSDTVASQDPDLFLSRQLSWLAFNRRVLELADDERLPVLERVRLLGIAGDNLDGFFMKRVGALKREAEIGVPRPAPWPSATQELAEVRVEARKLRAEMGECLASRILPALAAAGIQLLGYEDLTDEQQEYLGRYFEQQLFLILTPLAVDPGRPFPFISNLSLSLAVVLQHEGDPPLFARVKVPANRPRWVRLPDTWSFVPLEQVIAQHLERLFRRMTILSAHPFRVTRSADVSRDEAAADDLMDYAAEVVQERRFAPAVRLELASGMPDQPRALLAEELAIESDDIYPVDGLLGLTDLRHLAAIDLPELRRPPWTPVPHPLFPLPDRGEIDPAALFAAIRQHDILVHHPYHDYDKTVVAFVDAAARDEQVLAIKQSIYRSSVESPTLEALLRAAEAGKEVAALVELQARLDEAGNIAWARRLEESGIHTSYGFVGFKTHTRMTLVVREEGEGLRVYVHVSTGDYNRVTAQSYTDVGLFTARPEIGADVTEFFNFLSGYADVPSYRSLVAAPTDMREHFLELIEREIEHQRAGRGGAITAMMNALVDVPLTTALYRASQAGVKLDLIVRGECCLVPGRPGVSDNIRVRSVLGRFLEHARIFRFRNGGDDTVYIGSGDWMYRNLDHRLEGMLPIRDPRCRADLMEILEVCLADTAGSWELRPDGTWERVQPAPGEEPLGAQEELMRRALAQGASTNTSSPSTLTS